MPRQQLETWWTLRSAACGDSVATTDLERLLYDELRQMARAMLVGERRDHTLQATALVHEAWVRLCGEAAPDSGERNIFLAHASRVMRNVLVDHARRRRASKRGGDRERLFLDEILAVFEQDHCLLELDEALARLAQEDARCARVVELRFFSGLTLAEVGSVLELSTAHVHRMWEFARAWLQRELTPRE